MNDDVIVTMQHVRQAKMCAKGTRKFFEQHSLDYQDFLKNGIPASELKKLDDAMVNQVIEVAYGRK